MVFKEKKFQEGKKNSLRKQKFDLSKPVFGLLVNCIFILNSVLVEVLIICGQILNLNVFIA